jgi:hypothetical protein
MVVEERMVAEGEAKDQVERSDHGGKAKRGATAKPRKKEPCWKGQGLVSTSVESRPQS